MLKTGLFILSFFEEKLLKFGYEDIVQFINELPRTEFFYSEDIRKEYQKSIKRFNIPQSLLDRLNLEYKQICSMSQEYKNTAKKSSAFMFKHFIKDKQNKNQAVYFFN